MKPLQHLFQWVTEQEKLYYQRKTLKEIKTEKDKREYEHEMWKRGLIP